MTTLTTNEWIRVTAGCKPWPKREVLVLYPDGQKENLAWNGFYWYDPHTGVRKLFPPKGEPTHFYIYEKFPHKS